VLAGLPAAMMLMDGSVDAGEVTEHDDRREDEPEYERADADCTIRRHRFPPSLE
jgi:hypothetical protein